MVATDRASTRESPPSNRRLRTSIAGALAGALALASSADARIVSVKLNPSAPAFTVSPGVNYSWPGVGEYEKITGVAYGEVDPGDPRNAVIVDINLAEPQAVANVPGVTLGSPGKTAGGKVAYLLNFYILKPKNLTAVDHSLNGYGKAMYEPPNRGNKTWTALGRVSGGGNDPATISDPAVLGNAFLMPRGYVLVWSGWEPLVALASLNTSLTGSAAIPIAKGAGGSTISAPAYEYIVSGANSFALSYPAANSADTASAKLTHRVHLEDDAAHTDTIPAFGSPGCAAAAVCWEYTSVAGTAIRLTTPGHVAQAFTANDIYEFSYTAKDPWIAGLGFAAVRDFNSWLKYASAADGNPVAGYLTRIYTEISSQPGRLLNDFRHLGFNEDESGRKVLDGHMQWISAGSGIGMNYRFSQSGRTERNRQDHLYPENLFPFANVPSTDPFTGITDSRYAKCQTTNTCPLGMEIYSANEYWVKTASLLHTKPDGSADLPDSPYARNYFMSSMRHGTGNAGTDAAPNRGLCQQRDNPLNSAPVQRALWLALDKWSTQGLAPPSSRVPKLSDATMALPTGTGFPTNIPDPFLETPNHKVTYTGLKTTRHRFNLGPNFYTTGIPSIFPPVITPPIQNDTAVPVASDPNGPVYPSFVPVTDSDGNDIAGVRLPDVTVPLGTYTGWALRRGAQANDGCEAAGQFIAFPVDETARNATQDPRPSVAARYPTFADYDGQIITAMNQMIQDRLLLCEDGSSELKRLRDWGATRGVPNAPAPASYTPYSFPLANTSITPSKSELWPPNGKMVPVTLKTSAPDTCSATCSLVGVSGTDGATAADWQITGALSANLRSTRSGTAKDGRVYTLQLQCTDSSDSSMTATKTVEVRVPHDQGH